MLAGGNFCATISALIIPSEKTVKNILTGRTNKSNIWNVNTENEYHESK